MGAHEKCFRGKWKSYVNEVLMKAGSCSLKSHNSCCISTCFFVFIKNGCRCFIWNLVLPHWSWRNWGTQVLKWFSPWGQARSWVCLWPSKIIKDSLTHLGSAIEVSAKLLIMCWKSFQLTTYWVVHNVSGNECWLQTETCVFFVLCGSYWKTP